MGLSRVLNDPSAKQRLGLFDPLEDFGEPVVLFTPQLLFVHADLRSERQARGRQHGVGHAAPLLRTNLHALQLDAEDFKVADQSLPRVLFKVVAYVEKDIPVANPCAWIKGSCFARRSPMSVRHIGELGTVKRFKRR